MEKSPWPQVFRQRNHGVETSEEAIGVTRYEVDTQLEQIADIIKATGI